jgi:predicted transcriptional regulator of viral defense system
MALWRLAKKGSLLRVRDGLYAAVPPEYANSKFEIDRYVLFDRLMGSNGSIAYHSALEVHGVAYSRFTTVYYITTKKKPAFEFQDIRYRPVFAKELFGTTSHVLNDQTIQVTDKERTFLDCIRRPDLCGGLEEYLKSVEGFKLMRPVKLLDHLERFDEQSLNQRAGFILSLLSDRINVSDDLLEVLRNRVGKNIYYLVPGKRGTTCRLVKEWNLMVPRNLEEMVKYV